MIEAISSGHVVDLQISHVNLRRIPLRQEVSVLRVQTLSVVWQANFEWYVLMTFLSVLKSDAL